MLATEVLIGLVRGRTELGPRALGHRSLLMVPASKDIRLVLNKLKRRAWYRPVAPVTTALHAQTLLQQPSHWAFESPFMSFAPRMHAAAIKRYPGIVHVDGTARFQTVSEAANPYLYALLLQVGQRTAGPVLMNTSFNVKGKPILNRAATAIEIFREEHAMAKLVIEDWMFSRRDPLAAGDPLARSPRSRSSIATAHSWSYSSMNQ